MNFTDSPPPWIWLLYFLWSRVTWCHSACILLKRNVMESGVKYMKKVKWFTINSEDCATFPKYHFHIDTKKISHKLTPFTSPSSYASASSGESWYRGQVQWKGTQCGMVQFHQPWPPDQDSPLLISLLHSMSFKLSSCSVHTNVSTDSICL